MKLNHTGHEVFKYAKVAGHTKKFVFQWFSSCYRPFVFHLCKLLFNFSCLQYTQFEFVCYINVLCCICKIYIYSNVWFQTTSECFVSFKFLSMSCMGSFQWPFHYKKLLLSNKNICWATYLCSCDLFVIFSRAGSYIFFTYLFLIAQYY